MSQIHNPIESLFLLSKNRGNSNALWPTSDRVTAFSGLYFLSLADQKSPIEALTRLWISISQEPLFLFTGLHGLNFFFGSSFVHADDPSVLPYFRESPPPAPQTTAIPHRHNFHHHPRASALRCRLAYHFTPFSPGKAGARGNAEAQIFISVANPKSSETHI